MSVDQRLTGLGSADHQDETVAAPATDGRLLRSERTKQAIVDALLDLIRDGTLRPSSAQIAEKAGVTQRTLFNQFGDMETLFEAVTKRQTARVAHLLPTASEGSLEERAEHFAVQLSLLLEEVMNIRWAVLTTPDGLDRFGSSVELFGAVMRHQFNNAFGEELLILDPEAREQVLDILEIEADPVTWRMRRLQQRRSVEQASALVQRAILAILRDIRR